MTRISLKEEKTETDFCTSYKTTS